MSRTHFALSEAAQPRRARTGRLGSKQRRVSFVINYGIFEQTHCIPDTTETDRLTGNYDGTLKTALYRSPKRFVNDEYEQVSIPRHDGS